MTPSEKREATLIAKLGGIEAYNVWKSEVGRKGGNTGGSGFKNMTSEKHSEAGKKGGAALWKKLKEGQREKELS